MSGFFLGLVIEYLFVYTIAQSRTITAQSPFFTSQFASQNLQIFFFFPAPCQKACLKLVSQPVKLLSASSLISIHLCLWTVFSRRKLEINIILPASATFNSDSAIEIKRKSVVRLSQWYLQIDSSHWQAKEPVNSW